MTGTVDMENLLNTYPPVLVYRGTCPKCQRLSRLAVILSLGTLHRIPLDAPEAELLHRLYPQSQGRIAVFGQGIVAYGVKALFAAAFITLRSITRFWTKTTKTQ